MAHLTIDWAARSLGAEPKMRPLGEEDEEDEEDRRRNSLG